MSGRKARTERRAAGHKTGGRRASISSSRTQTPELSAPGSRTCTRLPIHWLPSTPPPVPPALHWYGNSPTWQTLLEDAARRQYGDRLRRIEHRGILEYRLELDVRGPNDLVEVSIIFHATPNYYCYDLHPQDYPQVWAEPGKPSKHRMPDGSLCLYFPYDPVNRRWTADKGLLDLINITIDHLAYEDHWRATGGDDGGRWLGDEAPHGLPDAA
ncbi:hypothetical protein H4P1_00048 (plasmid) [Variovorax sp. PBS-H4]|uniref:hypothetical protein n=1 Tax=Variovorax sp. PBS-H4 TaxID=434008 RepID=UPI0013160A43|nr:hypothetical protein [Variovorax sp. PBS-H4]VTU41416.1 hypothetical protein H4P1_00048 [Variovorax sp. PBS-H4]